MISSSTGKRLIPQLAVALTRPAELASIHDLLAAHQRTKASGLVGLFPAQELRLKRFSASHRQGHMQSARGPSSGHQAQAQDCAHHSRCHVRTRVRITLSCVAGCCRVAADLTRLLFCCWTAGLLLSQKLPPRQHIAHVAAGQPGAVTAPPAEHVGHIF
jgi:hypothetical protein